MSCGRHGVAFGLAVLVAQTQGRADDLHACVSDHEQAQLWKNAGKLAAARGALTRCSKAGCPSLVRSDCARWAAEIDAMMPSAVVVARGPAGQDLNDVRLVVDGALLTERLTGMAFDVDPGEHLVRLEAAGMRPAERRFVFSVGEKNRRIEVTLAPLSPAPPPREQGPPPREPKPRPAESPPPRATIPALSYVLAAGSAVAFGGFAYFYAIGRARENELRGTCSPHCSDDQISSARNRYFVADGFLAVGVVGLVTAVITAVVSQSPSRARATGAFPIAIGAAAASGAWTF